MVAVIKAEEDYQNLLGMLSQNNIPPYNKICKTGFEFIEI